MTDRRRLVIRFALFFLLSFVLAGFQTSFWYHLFGAMPGPVLWLTLVVYLSIYREFFEGLFSVYIVSLGLSVFTSMLEGILGLLILLLFFVARFFRSRIFWPGATYFMMVCGAAVPAYSIFHVLLSLYFEPNTSVHFDILRWVLQTCETVVAAVVLFPIYQWIDEVTKEENKESWSLKS